MPWVALLTSEGYVPTQKMALKWLCQLLQDIYVKYLTGRADLSPRENLLKSYMK